MGNLSRRGAEAQRSEMNQEIRKSGTERMEEAEEG
jgi:hypothetical protein